MTEPVAVPVTAESLGAVQGDAFRALLPADIQSKGYAKEINGFGDLVKKFDGAQTLLGQRAVPEVNAPPEQWAEFHTKAGRPAKIEDYSFPDAVEGVAPELVKGLTNSKAVRELLFSAGANPYQAKILLSGMAKLIHTSDQQATQKDKETKDAAFLKMTTELFGDQRETVITNGKKFLAANLPDNVKPLLDTLDDKSLAIVLAATDGMAKKFTREDPFRGGGGGGGGGGETREQIVAAMQAIMRDPAYGDPFKDRPKHEELRVKMEGLRGKLRILQGAA